MAAAVSAEEVAAAVMGGVTVVVEAAVRAEAVGAAPKEEVGDGSASSSVPLAESLVRVVVAAVEAVVKGVAAEAAAAVATGVAVVDLDSVEAAAVAAAALAEVLKVEGAVMVVPTVAEADGEAHLSGPTEESLERAAVATAEEKSVTVVAAVCLGRTMGYSPDHHK